MIQCSSLISFFFKKQAAAEKFADALFFVQQTLKKQHDERRALFESEAAQYRALAIKPPMSEEQRKHIVLANVLTQRKDYAGAIDLYLKAIDLDPVSYPGAYFNLALLYAQVQRHNKAISFMKQYLLLVPDAADARSAQDKIYEWELMINK
ncbi:MAG: tetratricopeptide repeat protein [Desulfobacterales bacterium]|nr:tetratricopeptide repeat protein [Desulfobacterales bacterium]